MEHEGVYFLYIFNLEVRKILIQTSNSEPLNNSVPIYLCVIT